MGNTSGALAESIEELGRSEEIAEEILEPLAREGFVCELSAGITTLLEAMGIASLAAIRMATTNEESGEEVFEEYEVELTDYNLIELFEDYGEILL